MANDTADFEVDPAVAKFLSPGDRVVGARYHGNASWATTAVIEVETDQGERAKYFLKFDKSDKSTLMLRGERASMTALWQVAPDVVPRPIAWGRFEKDTATAFLLLEFIDIDSQVDDISLLGQRLAEIHTKSASPEGHFGFPIVTCHGTTKQPNDWDNNWTRYFTKLLTYSWQCARAVNPPHAELDAAFEKLVMQVVPAVLDPLQADGRSIKPSLVHGDLWSGNVGTNARTRQPVIFDAAAFYAHNEYELGTWYCHYFDEEYFTAYQKHLPPSEPVEQYEDRLRLYSLKFEIVHTIGWSGLVKYRARLLENMRYLIEKYEDPEGFVPRPNPISQEDIRREMTELHPRYASAAHW